MPYGPFIPPLPLSCTVGVVPPEDQGFWATFPNGGWKQDDILNMVSTPLGCSLRMERNPLNVGDETVADNYVKTRLPVDLRDGPVSISLTGGGTGGLRSYSLGANILQKPFAGFYVSGISPGSVDLIISSDYPNIFAQETIAYDPVAMKHLRIRSDGSDLVLETAPDCGPWTERLRETIAEAPVGDLWLFADHSGDPLQIPPTTWGTPRTGD
jgi:hypothetical protein